MRTSGGTNARTIQVVGKCIFQAVLPGVLLIYLIFAFKLLV